MESTLIEEEIKGPEEEFLRRLELLKEYTEREYRKVYLAKLFDETGVRYVAVKI